ncbi:MAG: imelysin family protein [Myxococcota bacterium]|nr:imelysin family protein [Myxococcota bacterium]
MDGNRLSFLTLTTMASLVLIQNQACTQDESKSPTTETAAETAAVSDVLAAIGPSVVLPTLERFSNELSVLEERLSSLQDSLGSAGYFDAQAEAQAQWVATMSVWQELEVMQLGPAGSSMKFVGGEDIRDQIYSWPTVNPCRVDQRTATEAWTDSDFFTDNLVNAYGLDALEHLLFASTDSECPSQVAPISDGAWDDLGEEGIQNNRADFALAIVQELQIQAQSLTDAWSPEDGNYSALLSVQTADSPYASETEALNAVYNSLFYLETSTKDRKLALPLGLRDCAEDLCLDELEGLASQTSLLSVRSNLVGFRNLFTGGEDAGMDDLLTDIGHGDLSEQILSDIDATISLADSIDTPLKELIVDDTDTAMEFYDSLAKVTTALKSDLATVLQMQIPSEAAGDND